jgi:hypothetical protein
MGVRSWERSFKLYSLFTINYSLKISKKTIKIKIAIIVAGIAIGKFIGGAFVTPAPPTRITLTLIKLLPLAPSIFHHYRGTTIDPSSGGFGRASVTTRAAKLFSVSCRFCPNRWVRAKGFHVDRYSRGILGIEILLSSDLKGRALTGRASMGQDRDISYIF